MKDEKGIFVAGRSVVRWFYRRINLRRTEPAPTGFPRLHEFLQDVILKLVAQAFLKQSY